MAYNTVSPSQSAANSAARASETLGNQAHSGIDRVTGTAHQAVDRVTSAASTAAERAGVMGQELLTAKDEWVDTARGYVREHPIAALGIALSIGYLLSRISGR